MQRRSAKQRVRSGGEHFVLVAVEFSEHECGECDGINPDIPTTAVCGATMNHELRPSKPAVAWTDSESRGLGDNCCVGTNDSRNEGACTSTAQLLVGDRRENPFSCKSMLRGMPRRLAHCPPPRFLYSVLPDHCTPPTNRRAQSVRDSRA